MPRETNVAIAISLSFSPFDSIFQISLLFTTCPSKIKLSSFPIRSFSSISFSDAITLRTLSYVFILQYVDGSSSGNVPFF